MPSALDGLNDAQRAAAQNLDGPTLILAGAGSGKTRTLTHRTAHIIETRKADASQVLVVTFTNKAAGELRERLTGLLGEHDAQRVWAMTFHALCVRILRRSAGHIGYSNDFTIVDAADSRKLIKQAADDIGFVGRDDRDEMRKIVAVISSSKNKGRAPEDFDDARDSFLCAMRDVWRRYQTLLRDMDGVDFDDLLVLANRVLDTEHGQVAWGMRFSYVLVDEYQDTNSLQDQIIRKLCVGHDNLCVVGDDFQCLAADTLITMADGSDRPVQDIRVGDDVLAYFGNSRWRSAKVSAVRPSQTVQVVRIVTETNKTLTVTADHPQPAGFAPATSEQRRVTYLSSLLSDSDRQVVLAMNDEGPMHRVVSVIAAPDVQTAKAAGFDVQRGAHGDDLVSSTFEEFGHAHDFAVALAAVLGYRLTQTMEVGVPSNDTRVVLPVIRASSVRPGMTVATQHRLEKVTDVQVLDEPCSVFDINVDHAHNFLANGISTHNCIYGFRSADVRNILTFPERWPGTRTFKLETNYRSQANVVAAANAVISGARHKTDKVSRAVQAAADPVRLIEFRSHWDEADHVARTVRTLFSDGASPDDIAVLYRTNGQSQIIEEKLTRAGIPYKVVGGVEFNRRVEVQGVRAYLSLLVNRRDRLAFARAVAWPRRGVGDKAQQTLIDIAQQADGDIRAAGRNAIAAGQVRGKAATGLTAFLDLLDKAQTAAATATTDQLLAAVVRSSGLEAHLKTQGEQGRDQLQNIDQLRGLAARIPGPASAGLAVFLEATALAEADPKDADRTPKVSLMTMHAAKGLEFKHVMCVGLEDELFVRSAMNDDEEDECRRLLYVAMTRAERTLLLSFCRSRFMYGQQRDMRPLRYLAELPAAVQRMSAKTRSQPPSAHRTRDLRTSALRTPASSRDTARQSPVRTPRPSVLDGRTFSQGARVQSPTFGAGTVKTADKLGVTVRFDSGATMKVLASTLKRI